MNKRILVSGGAGYIGCVLVRLLLEKGYRVRVIDNLSFGGEPIVDLLNHPQFEFIKGDVRNPEDVTRALEGEIFGVAHMASIVGDPACAKQPELAQSTNLEGSKLLYSMANARGVKRFIFASTCSNYGKMSDPDSLVHEESTLAPVSLYAETKVAVEKFLLTQPAENTCKPTVLRFSTVYGLSLRPRFDLTVNEFTKELALGRELTIFGEQFWRPYCHVVDLARSVITVLEASENLVDFEVYNVGDTSENYQKQMIVEEIKKQIPGVKVKYVQKNEDPRDYRVSFEKIKTKLGFRITMKVPEGIAQIRKAVTDKFILNPDDGRYRNV
jgi:nucleoside-diphosphate-sugar epimerase